MDGRQPGFKTGMIRTPEAHHTTRPDVLWVRFKRLVGIPTVNGDMEGQLRYSRGAAATEGHAYLAKMGANSVMAWHRVLAYPYGTPTATPLAAAGATAAASIQSSGNDTHGTIRVQPSGAGIAAGDIVDMNFAVARPNTSYTLLLTPASSAARALGMVVGRSGRTTAKVTIATATALTSGSTYDWDYLILG